MRLWTIHPAYLDSVGLVALWREGLLAQKVLLGLTKGYTRHPQLHRFRACPDPVSMICSYLHEVAREAKQRGYRFDESKIFRKGASHLLKVHQGQVAYEWQHLLLKLQSRSPKIYDIHQSITHPQLNPLFEIVPGGIEEWERA